MLKKTDLNSYVTTSVLNSKGYLTTSSLSDYAKKTDLNSYATTSSLSSYIKTSTLKSYVTETWQSGTSWYRKYSDGWIEQGGVVSAPSNSTVTTFHNPFKNTNYTIFASPRVNGNFWTVPACAYPESSSSFRHGVYGGSSDDMSWYACGY